MVRSAMLESIQHDHEVDLKTAEEILMAQGNATRHYTVIRDFLGERYGGAWFEADLRKLVVGTTNSDDFEWIQLVGGQPLLVEYSAADLRAISSIALATLAGQRHVQSDLSAWVDFRSNLVRVEISDGSLAHAHVEQLRHEFAAWPISFEPVTGESTLFSQLAGGQRFNNYDHPIGLQECSIGFGVVGGFLTAAHCGWSSHSIEKPLGDHIGDVIAASLPPEIVVIDDPDPGVDPRIDVVGEYFDHAFVATADGWSSSATVGSGSNSLNVNGFDEAAVGSTVCRFGSTTGGPWCGEILSKDFSPPLISNTWFSDLYPGNEPIAVKFSGLILARVCAERKDSGGPLVYVDTNGSVQAQGMLVGGNGATAACVTPENPLRRTWYSPVKEALQAFGVELRTVDPNSAPLPPGCCNTCAAIDESEKGENLECTVIPPGGLPPLMPEGGFGSFEPYCKLGEVHNLDSTQRRFFCGVSSNATTRTTYQWSGQMEGVAVGATYFGICEVGHAASLSIQSGEERDTIATILLNC